MHSDVLLRLAHPIAIVPGGHRLRHSAQPGRHVLVLAEHNLGHHLGETEAKVERYVRQTQLIAASHKSVLLALGALVGHSQPLVERLQDLLEAWQLVQSGRAYNEYWILSMKGIY